MERTTMTAALEAFVASIGSAHAADTSKNNAACTFVAVAYLSRVSKADTNKAAREACEAAYGAQVWKSHKSVVSRAYRGIAGEYGLGEALATMWANGDYSVSLAEAYEASGGPAKRDDRVAKAAKIMLGLSEAEREAVLEIVAERTEAVAAARHLQNVRMEQLLQKRDTLKVA